MASQAHTAADRRELRGKYRELHTEALEKKEALANAGSNALETMLDEIDRLHGAAAKAREQAVDAEVFCVLAEAGLAMVRKGQAAQTGRTPADLVTQLRALHALRGGTHGGGANNNTALCWAAVGSGAAGLFRAAPGVTCMLGTMDAAAPLRRAPTAPRALRRAAAARDELVRPDDVGEIGEADGEGKQETDRNMEAMWLVINAAVERVAAAAEAAVARAGGSNGAATARRARRAAAVPLSSVVCSHASFAQTVENVFTLSFLVRDQRVQLFSEPARGLMVRPVPKGADSAACVGGASGAASRGALQFVVSFTMADWELMKRIVAPGECLMPMRASAGAAAAAAAGAAAAATPAPPRRRAAPAPTNNEEEEAEEEEVIVISDGENEPPPLSSSQRHNSKRPHDGVLGDDGGALKPAMRARKAAAPSSTLA